MGNATVAEELLSADELDELYRLDASEPEPESGNEDDEDDTDQGDTDEGDEEVKPEGMPHP